MYQNCSAKSTVLSKNYVNITGGTILDTGIFVDTNLYTDNGSTEGFADSIDTQINISGGTVNGLIDLKIRHKNNTALTITGGDFTNAKMWVRKYASEYKGDEPTEPMVTISGGKFAFVTGKAFGLSYDCGATSWTSYEKPYAVSGGVFNVEVPETACAEGYIPVANTDTATKDDYPYTVIGDIIYPTGGDSVGVPVPVTWIQDNTTLITVGQAIDIPAVITGLGTTGANGVPQWQSYVLGLTPSEATSQVQIAGEKAVNDGGTFKVTLKGLNVSVPEVLAAKGTTVAFHLEESVPGSDSWTPRSDACTIDANGRPTFTVPLDGLSGKILRIASDIVTECK